MNKLKPIEVVGSRYFRDSLFAPKEEKISYGKNHLQIGRKKNGDIYRLDLSESCRIVMIGKNRSGKSFFLRGIADRLRLSGSDIFYATDIKDEFKSSRDPVQSKFRDHLFDGEKPTSTPVVTLRPTFFRQRDSSLPPKNFWYSPPIKSMEQADFSTLMKYKSLSQSQKITMGKIYSVLRNFFKSAKEHVPLSVISRIIDELENIPDATRSSLKYRMEPLYSSHYYDPEYERDIVNIIQRGFVPAINLEGFDNFRNADFEYADSILGMAIREVVNARRSKKIRKLWVMLDEAPRFLGVNKQNAVREYVAESFDLDARYGVNYLIITQSLNHIQESMIQQCRYFFLPANISVGELKECMTWSGLVRNQQNASNQALSLKKRLNPKNHEWVIIDSNMGTASIVRPAAPLSAHAETTK